MPTHRRVPLSNERNPVARARWLRAMTREQLAEATGISVRTISRIEAVSAGEKHDPKFAPSINQMARIARALDVRLDALIGPWAQAVDVKAPREPRNSPSAELRMVIRDRLDVEPRQKIAGVRSHFIWQFIARGKPWGKVLEEASTVKLSTVADRIAKMAADPKSWTNPL
jgi:transcriptional regulator with XRE-family HTH domain